MGFPVPFSRWTREDWNAPVQEVLLDRRTRERGIIDADAAAALLRDHQSGRTDGWDRLWMLLNLELWFRTFIDGDGVQTLSAPSSSDARTATVRASRESSIRPATDGPVA
jgi:asparagine synthase (glutamine-hydrolysing)